MLVPRFRIKIEPHVLDDLAVRLEQARFAPVAGSGGWDYGTSPEYLADLIDHWRSRYDWRHHESELNRITQYKTRLSGNDLHFVHERGQGTNTMPLLLLHGWPDSFYRFCKVVSPLSDPVVHGGDASDAFDIVVPSLPGFAFTGRVKFPEPAQLARQTAGLLWRLMTETLGYEKFAVAGGDVGRTIAQLMAIDHPESVIALHLTDLGSNASKLDPAKVSKEEQKYLHALEKQMQSDGGYELLQRTKPRSIAASLNDSPMGLASWIVDRFHSWSDHNGNLYNSFTQDDLLTNIMIYWVTGTIGSSMLTYHAESVSPSLLPHEFVERPVGLALFPKDIGGIPPRALAERVMNVQRWTEMPHGGHFAAFEVPELYVNDVRTFLREYRVDSVESVDEPRTESIESGAN